jgi:hypothetical protein
MPTAKTKPKKELWEQTIEISGPPKIGKTDLASQFPNPLFVLTEPGQGNRELNHWVHKDWKSDEPYILQHESDFDWIVKELMEDTHEYQTLILDTGDNACVLVTENILTENGVQSLNEGSLSFGRGTKMFERRFRDIMFKLAKLPMGLVIITHLKETTISRPNKEPQTAWRDTLNDHAKLIVHSMVDMIFMLRKEGKQRWIYTEGDLSIEAGSRIALPERISMGKTSGEAYENLIKAFYSGNGNKKQTKDTLITAVLKGEAFLSDNKIDSFDTDKRVMNSRKKHLLFADIEKASLANLEAYLQHLRTKARNGGNNGTT